jgi:hypothetical protein
MNNLFSAIMDKCADSAFSDDVGGRIFLDIAPEGTEFPYAVFSVISSSPQDTFNDMIEETSIQFSLYSTSKGLAEITQIYADLKTLLDWQLLTVTDRTCIWMTRDNLVTMFEDITTAEGTVGLRHWAVDYSILVQDAVDFDDKFPYTFPFEFA